MENHGILAMFDEDFTYMLNHYQPSKIDWKEGFIYEPSHSGACDHRLYRMRYVLKSHPINADRRKNKKMRISRAGRPIKYRNSIGNSKQSGTTYVCVFCGNDEQSSFVIDKDVICSMCGTCQESKLFSNMNIETGCAIRPKLKRDVHDHGFKVSDDPDGDPVENLEYQESIGVFSRHRYFMNFLYRCDRVSLQYGRPRFTTNEISKIMDVFMRIYSGYRNIASNRQLNYNIILFFILGKCGFNKHNEKVRLPKNKRNTLTQIKSIELMLKASDI